MTSGNGLQLSQAGAQDKLPVVMCGSRVALGWPMIRERMEALCAQVIDIRCTVPPCARR